MSVISREDAIKELMTWIPKLENGLFHWTGIKAMLENLPDADDGWIPVEDRLPEDGAAVLTTIHIPGRQPQVRSGRFRFGLFMNDNGDTWSDSDREVLAWMPRPPAYEPKEDKQ